MEEDFENYVTMEIDEAQALMEQAARTEYLEGLLDFLSDMIPNLEDVIDLYKGEEE